MAIIFTRPDYLLFLLAIPVLIFFQIVSLKTIRKKAIKFANFEAISKIKGVEIFSKNLTVLYVNIFVIILIVLSVSGTSITRNVETSELSFVLAIDSSGSMAAQDITPSRLDAAKQVSIDFLRMVPEKTKIAVLSFSGNAFVEQELTEDKDLLKVAIGNIEQQIIGGTDILGAVISSTNLLRGEESKTIILISDGQANVNTLQSIVEYSNNNNVMIHSLGIGTREGKEGEDIVFKLSEDTLETIAYNTDGQYYNIQNVEDFYSSLSDIIEVTKKRIIYDLSFYFMIAALILFIINFILINTKYRGLP